MTGDIFYVYEHWRPDTDVCFYVGKGKNNRAWGFRRRNLYYKNIVAKLSRLGMCVEVRMVRSGLAEDEALAIEVERIAFWRQSGIRIANLTLGGEGVSGLKHSDETRAKMKEGRKGQSRAKHSATMRGRKHSAEHRAKISAGLTGRPCSQKTREKISAAHSGRKRPDQARQNMCAAQIGKKHATKTVEKRSASLQRYWESGDRELRAEQTRAGFTTQVRTLLSQKATERYSTPEARALLREYAIRRWDRVRAERVLCK